MNRLFKCMSAMVVVLAAGGAAWAAVPYADNFETYTNNALLNGLGQWKATPYVFVTNAGGASPSGTNMVYIPADSWVSNDFGVNPTATNIWVDFWVRPKRYSQADADGPAPDTNASSMFFVNSNGYWVLMNSPSLGVVASNTITTNLFGGAVDAFLDAGQAVHVSAYLDYKAKRYGFMLEDKVVAQQLGFISNNAALTLFRMYNGANGTNYFDAFQVTNRVPNTLGTDGDFDGMNDAWELMYFGGVTQKGLADAGADDDGDGLSSELESQARSNPWVNGDPSGAYALPLPFVEYFETRTLAPVSIFGQLGWNAEPQPSMAVQQAIKYQGNNALQMSGYGFAGHTFNAAMATNVWTHMVMKPVLVTATQGEITNFLSPSATVAFYVDTNGWVNAYSNNQLVRLTNILDGVGGVVATYEALTNNVWARFVANSDYNSKQWSLYLANMGSSDTSSFARLIGKNLGFRQGANNPTYQDLSFTNFPGGTSYVDNIEITMDMSPWIDTDNDKAPDKFEIQFGMNPTNPLPDFNSNSVVDRADYAFGSTNARVTSVDRVGVTANALLTFAVGSNRTYMVMAAPDPVTAKTPVGSFFTGTLGQNNAFTHTNAMQTATRMFYTVAAVSPEGLSGGTSSVVYAWYRQNRGPTGTWHWVTVPVDYGPSNTLASTLGQHLARGLTGAGAEALADSISIMVNGVWSNYWWNGSAWNVGGLPATPAGNVPIPAGAGVLVRRKTLAPPANTNALFAGACRTNASVTIPISSGWNFVGWPFDVASANWGFVGQGSDSVTNSDEVWFKRTGAYHARLWADNQWRLIPSGALATNAITLQAGEGFYYRSRRASATTWVPSKP
jgi:hypothetical protein